MPPERRRVVATPLSPPPSRPNVWPVAIVGAVAGLLVVGGGVGVWRTLQKPTPVSPAVDSPDPTAGFVALGVFAVYCVVSLALYLIPTGVALLRKHPQIGMVAVINVLLGWTCVGWVVSLAIAASAKSNARGRRD